MMAVGKVGKVVKVGKVGTHLRMVFYVIWEKRSTVCIPSHSNAAKDGGEQRARGTRREKTARMRKTRKRRKMTRQKERQRRWRDSWW